MDFNLTNGTISSLTITTDKNLDSATVTGANYVIDGNTITLTNLTSSLVLELTGELSSSTVNKIHIGTLNTKNFYIGTLGVSKIYLGQYLVYTKGESTEEYFELSDGQWLYTMDDKAFEVIERLISFTILNGSFQAEEGMTWAEWCDSEYNTNGHYISGNLVSTSNGTMHVRDVVSTDIIIDGQAYTLENSSGG